MRILIITSRYLPHAGGLEEVVRNLTREFRRADHETVIVTNRYPRTLSKREFIDGVAVYRLLFLYPRLFYLKSGRVDLWLAGFVFFPLTLLQLLTILIRFRPDVMNLHYLGTPGLFVWLVHHLLPIRLVVSLHGGDVDGEPRRSRFNCWLFRAVTSRAAAVTVCSGYLLQRADALEPRLADKACVIHNGVNLEQFANAPPFPYPRHYLLTLGQLVSHKGFDLLIRAFGSVAGRFPNVDLLIAGDGPAGAKLEALARKMNLEKRVVFVGKVPTDKVAMLLKGCRFAAVPSYREAFGVVVLEAMAAGRPVLATPVGGIPEFAETPCNRLVAPDEDLWVKALGAMLEQTLKNGKMCQANQMAASRYQWSTVAQRYLALYEPDRCEKFWR